MQPFYDWLPAKYLRACPIRPWTLGRSGKLCINLFLPCTWDSTTVESIPQKIWRKGQIHLYWSITDKRKCYYFIIKTWNCYLGWLTFWCIKYTYYSNFSWVDNLIWLKWLWKVTEIWGNEMPVVYFSSSLQIDPEYPCTAVTVITLETLSDQCRISLMYLSKNKLPEKKKPLCHP